MIVRPVVIARGDSWVVMLGDDEFHCETAKQALELAADFAADLASQYVRPEE